MGSKRAIAYIITSICFLIATIGLFISGYKVPSIFLGVMFLVYTLAALFTFVRKPK